MTVGRERRKSVYVHIPSTHTPLPNLANTLEHLHPHLHSHPYPSHSCLHPSTSHSPPSPSPRIMRTMQNICIPEPRKALSSMGWFGGRNTSPWTNFHPVSSNVSSCKCKWRDKTVDRIVQHRQVLPYPHTTTCTV